MNSQQKTEYVAKHSRDIPYLELQYNESDDVVLTLLDGCFVEAQHWDDYRSEIELRRANQNLSFPLAAIVARIAYFRSGAHSDNA